MQKIASYLVIIALILPNPAYATRDMTGKLKPSSSLEDVPLLNENGTPNTVESQETRTKKEADRCFWAGMSCFYVFAAGCIGGLIYWATRSVLPAPGSACDHVCWYLHDFPGLPQGGYFHQNSTGGWVFVNCTTNESTPASTLSATMNTLTAAYPGQVDFVGTHDGYPVCQNINSTNPLNSTTIANLIEETGGRTTDEADDDKMPRLIPFVQGQSE